MLQEFHIVVPSVDNEHISLLVVFSQKVQASDMIVNGDAVVHVEETYSETVLHVYTLAVPGEFQMENKILLKDNCVPFLIDADTTINLSVNYPKDSEVPCILDIICQDCMSNDNCEIRALWESKELNKHLDLTKYGTSLEYKCPFGQEYVYNDTNTIGKELVKFVKEDKIGLDLKKYVFLML